MHGFVPVFSVAILMISLVLCNGDSVSVINRVDDLNEELLRLKKDVVGVETAVLNKIDSAKISLRSELRNYLHQYVSEAMKELLQGESIEVMVRSQVLSEVRQLKKGNHQMKRQLRRVLASYRDLQEDVNTCKEATKKTDRDASTMQNCSVYIVESEILRRDLEQSRVHVDNYHHREVQKDKELLEMTFSFQKLNQTCLLKLLDRNTSTPETVTPPTSAPLMTSAATTAQPEEEKSRIIVAPRSNSIQYQFRQLNIHTNTITTYPMRNLKYVTSVTYISKLRKLLIGLESPDKIISSNLDIYHISTVRENVETWGMAVDEERGIVFMTTYAPRYTISRMTTNGKYFTAIVELNDYGSYPRSIAVNTKTKTIYGCNSQKVFMLTYDGLHLQTLATGTSMYALDLDNTGNILYYNDGKKLMSLSQNVTREVTTLSVIPSTVKCNNKTVYFSSYSYPATIGGVDIGHNTVMYTLQQNIINNVNAYIICLVP